MTIVSSMAGPHWRREASCLTARLSSSVSKAASLLPGRHAYLSTMSKQYQQPVDILGTGTRTCPVCHSPGNKLVRATTYKGNARIAQRDVTSSRSCKLNYGCLAAPTLSLSLGPYLQEARDVEPSTGLQSFDRNQNLLQQLALQSRGVGAHQLLSHHFGSRRSRNHVVGALEAYGEALERSGVGRV